MGHTSIVLIAGLIFLIRYEPPETAVEFNNAQIIFWTCLLTAAPVFLAYLTRKLNIFRVAFVFDFLCLVGYVYNLYKLNLPEFINTNLAFLEIIHHSREFFSLIPLFIGLLGIRVAIHEEKRTQWEHLNFNFRFLLFPLFPMLAINAVLDLGHLLPETVAGLLVLVMLVPLLALPHILAPLMMQFLWKTKPLTDTVLKEKLEQLTKQSGIKYRDIAVWQTGYLSIANAAVAGILPGNRRIYLTDVLIRNFTDEQIETIVAHEIGHIRHRHLLISCFVMFGYLLSYMLFYQLVGKPLESILSDVPILLSIVLILFFLFYFKVFFNYLSRRFEHQADLYAADLTDKPEIFKSALESLGFLSRLPKPIRFIFEAFSTHPSLEHRLTFLDRSTAKNPSVQRYRKCLLEVKVLIALIPIFGVLIYLISM